MGVMPCITTLSLRPSRLPRHGDAITLRVGISIYHSVVYAKRLSYPVCLADSER